LQDAFQELKDVLCREGFPVDEDEEKLEEDPNEEDLNETYDEDEVYSLPLDEVIHTSSSPAHQEDNMMSYNHFENFDDALLHECGNKENCQKDLDEVSLAEGLNETMLSPFPFEENEFLQSCEEVINSYDADEFVEQPSNTVDDHIDDFIQVGRRIWDVGCFIIDRDPIYEIEGGSQEEGVEVTYLEDWSSSMYDSDIWKPDDDLIIDLFEDDRSQHFQDDFQSSLGTCDAYHFGDAYLLYEDSQPPSSSILEE
jgi:hypothetical protein